MGDTQQQTQNMDEVGYGSVRVKHEPIFQLRQTTILKLETRRSILLPPRGQHHSKVRRSRSVEATREEDVVECGCGWNEEEDDMVRISMLLTFNITLTCTGFLRFLQHLATFVLLWVQRMR